MNIPEIVFDAEAVNNVVHYWSYGMLCDPANMNYDGVSLISRAALDGYKLELLTHANIIRADTTMWGSLWQINQEVLDILDMIEGYPYYYDRISKKVRCGDRYYDAQIYVMTPESRQNSIKAGPGEHYIRQIASGYKHAGIPIAQLTTAIEDYKDRLQRLA